MPLLSTRGAASASGFGAFSNIGGGYWIGLLSGSSIDQAKAITVDSSSNVYVCGSSRISSRDNIQLAKYNATGAIQWQRRLSDSSVNAVGESVFTDSSNNVYVCGLGAFSGGGQFAIVKYDTSGTLQWQNYLTTTLGRAYGVTIDTSGNVYVCGNYYDGAYKGLLVKYNTGGVVQWRSDLYGISIEIRYFAVTTDSSGNIYACGTANNDIVLTKTNSSGTLQWQRTLNGATDNGASIAADSSGNVYVCGSSTLGGTSKIQIAKYNTSGTIQWQRTLGSQTYGYSIAVDAASNVYVVGLAINSQFSVQLAKYDSAGSIQWQRYLRPITAAAYGTGVFVDSTGKIYVCGYTDAALTGSNEFLIAKLPNNGSKTKTYIVGGYPFIYAGSSQTDAASSLTAATSTYNTIAPSLSGGTATMTDSASSLTSSVTLL